ncbi:hypothetical protein V7S43_001285 [Phytophthora oleae]|uniref:Translin-associated factor X-interacting protein 1 N-terminal domain-containing protein n=1 Tax=Phytophthora oleae TaxID=2107226 RepID=A0ABD3G4J3_9STRA
MQVPVVEGARLTHVEEQLFLRVQDRFREYFQHFEELEGFTVLRGNLERLQGKVEFELRSVFLHHHDAAVKAEQLQVEVKKLERQCAMCDRVIAAARKMAKSAPAALEKRTNELQAFHAADVKQRENLWTVQADKRLQDHLQVLSGKYARALELLHIENAQHVEVMKQDLEAKKNAEIEYMRVQTRLQLASQIDRETRDLDHGRVHHRARYRKTQR